jgi:starvation-inducible outer membrane lipoprotein
MKSANHVLNTRAAICLAALLGVLFLGLSGCVSLPAEEQGNGNQLPWNSPAGWEGTTIGVPY